MMGSVEIAPLLLILAGVAGSYLLVVPSFELQPDQARSRYADVPEIAHLQVGEQHQGQGVGSAIIAAAQAVIATRGHARAALGVDQDNPRASALYLRLGYEPTGLVDTLGYTWVDLGGVSHPEIEHTELLVKELFTGVSR